MKKALIGLGAIWAFALLFFVWQWSQNGRYQFSDTAGVLTDTRTGKMYRYHWVNQEWKTPVERPEQ